MKSEDGIESEDMQDKWKSLDKAGDKSLNLTSTKPLIQRVTPILRNTEGTSNEHYFTPISVAIGPLHHEKKELHRSEEFKQHLAAKFIKYSGKKTEDFYKNVMKEINSLRACYDSKDVSKKKWIDEELAWMFLVDGCALLNFIYLDVHKEWKKLGCKNDLVAFAKLDLFLLENQLPYQLLKTLMKTCTRVPSYDEKVKDPNPERVLEGSIISFINMNDMSPLDMEQHKQKPLHQTHGLIQDIESPPHDHHQYQHQQQQREREGEEGKEPAHLLELLRRRLVKRQQDKKPQQDRKYSNDTLGKNWHTFRNIKELKEHGILFKASKTSNVMDITFYPIPFFCMATLELPPIKVDDYTAPKLMNLIAYEMCPDFMNDFEITSYVSFLDSLIDKAEDVKELRDARVLDNRLGSDKAVARLFNKISTNLVPNPNQYKDLKHKIQEHCNTTWTTHVAQLYHTYFSSPWSVLAFLGALLGLSLTAAQTYKCFNDKPSSQN